MRTEKTVLCILGILGVHRMAPRISAQPPAQSKRIVIAASSVLDGNGHVLLWSLHGRPRTIYEIGFSEMK